MTDADVVQAAADILGGTVNTATWDKRGNRKPAFYVAVYGQKAENAMLRLGPLLYSRRREKIEDVLGAQLTAEPGRDIVWLAGLLEGEGYFVAEPRKSGKPVLRVALKMCDEDVVSTASELMSAPSVRRYQPKNPKHSAYWETKVNGRDAERVMRSVLPYMYSRRERAIKEALEKRRSS